MRAAWLGAFCVLCAPIAVAQDEVVPQPIVPSQEQGAQVRVIPSPVLVVDLERLYAESDFGKRIESEYESAGLALEADNADFQAELEAEERSIAERREEMTVEAFRAEAEAFDVKVQQIRAQQDARVEALEAARLAGQIDFQERARPILGQIMIDNRGVVLLEHTDAYLFLTSIDITDQAIVAVNSVLGDGTDDP